MKELINFSGYSVDLERFDNSWDEVAAFTRTMGCTGIELLIGGEYDTSIPPDLVTSVHLPGWLGWVRLWREPETVPADCDPNKLLYYFGAQTREELIRIFTDNLEKSANLGARYAVFHVTHIELEDFFTRRHRYTHEEVLTASAELLNAVCSQYPGGEPPVTIGLENLWWPGLTFMYQEEVDLFTSRLSFDNWIFVLDTGHLMNALEVTSEEEGVQQVIRKIKSLSPDTIDKIRSVHLQCSVSGDYQKKHFYQEPPEGFSDLSYSEQISLLMPMITQLDRHDPFLLPQCREILDYLSPDYVVHEFISRSKEELEEKLTVQRRTLGL